MRAIQFCKTCDFRLPYCVRTDRHFCGERCRIWWYRHPGQKRPDFSPRQWGQPEPPGKGQPRTLAEALQALADSREYAAQLEAVAKEHEREDRNRHDQLTEVRDAATASKIRLLTERDELKYKLDEAQQQLAQVAQQDQATTAQTQALREQAETLTAQLKQTEDKATQSQAAHEQASNALTELRKVHEQHIAQHTDEVGSLKTQTETLTALRDQLNLQNETLACAQAELHGRVQATERTLAQRDEDLSQQRQNFTAVERAHQEVHVVAESESRSLRAEKERRIAAEQRIEQLTRDLELLARAANATDSEEGDLVPFAMWQDALTQELHSVRLHRDTAIAEYELLSARILKLMAPGQYLEHAAAAGYDVTKDPLIRLKREEVLVENRRAAWQRQNKKNRRARPLDPEQTLDEQAYAAALTFRWKQINQPHLGRKQKPRWLAVGFLLDAESERYLLTLTQKRIEDMQRKMAAG